MAAVTTTRTALVALFKTLGVDTAGEWPADKLKTKAEGGLAKYLEPGQVLEGETKALFDQIEAANKEQAEITVTADAPEEKPAKKPVAKKATTPGNGPSAATKRSTSPTPTKTGKPKPAAGGDTKAPTQSPEVQKPAAKPKRAGGWKPGDPPLPFDETRGPGVIRTLVDLLKGASAEKPLTKEAAVKKLKAEFPDRDAAKLATTVNNQIPSRLRIVRGIHVWSNQDGYWIDGEGKKPQPKAEKARPTPKTQETQVPSPKSGGKSATPKPSPAAKSAKPAAAKPAGKTTTAKKTVAGRAMAKAQGKKK